MLYLLLLPKLLPGKGRKTGKELENALCSEKATETDLFYFCYIMTTFGEIKPHDVCAKTF